MAVMLGRACKIVGSLRSQVTAKQLLYEVRHIVGLIWQSLNNKAILSAEVVSSIPQSLQKKKTIQSAEDRGFDPQIAAEKYHIECGDHSIYQSIAV